MTKLLVLGKAKVISYKDLEEVQVKRTEKETARAAKGKSNRRRKRKSSAPEAEEATADKGKRSRKRKRPSPEPEALEPMAKVARISNAQVAEDKIVPKLWRAPVARMY